MDLNLLISVLSVMFTWTLSTVLSAPSGETPAASTASPRRHVRTKRCSCATFLDKECVYFCHLDIIWVNTPERVVSYGLGNAPRTKRAAVDSMVTSAGARCRCLREEDESCSSFCRRSELIRPPPGDGCSETQNKQQLAEDTGAIKRMEKQVSLDVLGVALKTRLLLEKWRVTRRHRARAREAESVAS
ncbi:endothelin-1 [Seriola dumerili]|uniref:Endothelin-1 n=1 Tax=Seriola dumerili TaxID=41447 RepID=A0A3B4TU49_SERDU|nr:endothelin-1 [Seriola dumerili]